MVSGKTFLILGMGRSGQATSSWLTEKGAQVLTWDDGVASNSSFTEIENIPWENITAVVQSPGVPFSYPSAHPVTAMARSKGIAIISDLDLLRKSNLQASYIGITGTNGKSTTTALIGHLLTQCKKNCVVGGNIGTPALSLPRQEDKGTYVLELSSFQLEISDDLNLDIVAWLNISEDHLDRHGSLESYIEAKEKIFKGCKAAIIGIDDSFSLQVYNKLSSTVPIQSISVTQKADIWIENGILYEGEGKVTDLKDIATLKGVHNHQNAAVAFAVARKAGLTAKEISEALKTFPGLPHRLEIVQQSNNITFVNDSKATNADATARALESYKDYRIYWIAGGKPKSQGISPLLSYFPNISHTFLIGEAQESFAKTLDGHTSYKLCGNLENALEQAFNLAKNNSSSKAVILLSPACASYDQFLSFEHRGDIFRSLVRKLQ